METVEARRHVIQVRVSGPEKAAIEAAAALGRMTVSEFLRGLGVRVATGDVLPYQPSGPADRGHLRTAPVGSLLKRPK